MARGGTRHRGHPLGESARAIELNPTCSMPPTLETPSATTKTPLPMARAPVATCKVSAPAQRVSLRRRAGVHGKCGGHPPPCACASKLQAALRCAVSNTRSVYCVPACVTRVTVVAHVMASAGQGTGGCAATATVNRYAARHLLRGELDGKLIRKARALACAAPIASDSETKERTRAHGKQPTPQGAAY